MMRGRRASHTTNEDGGIMKRLLFALALVVSSGYGFPAAAADKPLVVELWPGKAPGETADVGAEKMEESNRVKRVSNVSRPTLTVFRPARDKDTGAAVVIAPGGGYNSPGTWRARRWPTGSTPSASPASC
jgi:hypothetical protein